MKEFLEYAESHVEEILATLRNMVEMESFTAACPPSGSAARRRDNGGDAA